MVKQADDIALCGKYSRREVERVTPKAVSRRSVLIVARGLTKPVKHGRFVVVLDGR
jgi:hypothetical protein